MHCAEASSSTSETPTTRSPTARRCRPGPARPQQAAASGSRRPRRLAHEHDSCARGRRGHDAGSSAGGSAAGGAGCSRGSIDRVDHAARPLQQLGDAAGPADARTTAGCGRGTSIVREPGLDDALRVQPLQAHGARLGQLDRGEPHVLALHRHLGQAGLAGPRPEPRDREQPRRPARRLAVPVQRAPRAAASTSASARTSASRLYISSRSRSLRDVVVRQVGVDGQLDARPRAASSAAPPSCGTRATASPDQPDVEVEADVGDVAGLLAAEQVAGAADLQVLHRDRHAAAEVGVLGQRREPLVGGLGERLLRRVEEVGVGPLAGSADAAAQLVELGEPEGVGALDDHRVGVGDVEAGLDDRGAHEHVEALLPEVDHHLLELVLAHLPVGGRDPRLGHELA